MGKGEAGFSMVATMIGLVVVALGVVLLLSSSFHSGGTSSGVAGSPGVAIADRVQAQQSLSTALTAAETAAAVSPGYGGLTASQLQSSNPAITFESGPSSGPTTVSVAVSSGTSSSDGSGVDGVSAGVGGTPSSITMADRSSDRVCWLVWKSDGSDAWYGAQTDLASCTAPALSAAPAPGPVSATSVGWQKGSFPSP
jgi:hypothetical protein